MRASREDTALGAARSAICLSRLRKASRSRRLKKKLIDMCKERGKPYGMLVRKLDFPFSAGRVSCGAGPGRRAIRRIRAAGQPAAAGLSRVSRRPEELVRGLRFRGVSTRSLRDILAASQETALFDYVNNARSAGHARRGRLLAPTSVVAPALLFEEIEFEVPQEQLPKLPVVPPPAPVRPS